MHYRHASPKIVASWVLLAPGLLAGLVACSGGGGEGGGDDGQGVDLVVVAVDRTGVADRETWAAEVAGQVGARTERAMADGANRLELIGIGSNTQQAARVVTVDLGGVEGNTAAKRDQARRRLVESVAEAAGQVAAQPVTTNGTDAINLVAYGWAMPRFQPGDEVYGTTFMAGFGAFGLHDLARSLHRGQTFTVGLISNDNFGRFSIRPEAYAEFFSLSEEQPPFRFSYVGRAYRAVSPQRGQMREFMQVGVELLGAPAPDGTAEVIEVLNRHGFDQLYTHQAESIEAVVPMGASPSDPPVDGSERAWFEPVLHGRRGQAALRRRVVDADRLVGRPPVAPAPRSRGAAGTAARMSLSSIARFERSCSG